MVPPIEPTKPPINLEFLSAVELLVELSSMLAEVGTAMMVVMVVSGLVMREVDETHPRESEVTGGVVVSGVEEEEEDEEEEDDDDDDEKKDEEEEDEVEDSTSVDGENTSVDREDVEGINDREEVEGSTKIELEEKLSERNSLKVEDENVSSGSMKLELIRELVGSSTRGNSSEENVSKRDEEKKKEEREGVSTGSRGSKDSVGGVKLSKVVGSRKTEEGGNSSLMLVGKLSIGKDIEGSRGCGCSVGSDNVGVSEVSGSGVCVGSVSLGCVGCASPGSVWKGCSSGKI